MASIKIFDSIEGKTVDVDVSDEIYNEIKKLIDQYYNERRNEGVCNCFWRAVLYNCTTDCSHCIYRKSPSGSKKYEIADADSYVDTYTDDHNIEEIIDQHLLSEKIKSIFKTLDHTNQQILIFVLHEISEREAARRLNMPKSTYRRKKLALFEIIKTFL